MCDYIKFYQYFIQMLWEMLSSVMVWVVHLFQIDESAVFKTQLPLCTVHATLTQASSAVHP